MNCTRCDVTTGLFCRGLSNKKAESYYCTCRYTHQIFNYYFCSNPLEQRLFCEPCNSLIEDCELNSASISSCTSSRHLRTLFLCKTSSVVYFNQLKGAFSTRKLVIITNVWTFSDFFGNIGWNELKSWKLGTPSRSWLAFVCQPVLGCSQNIVFVNRFSVIFCLKLQKHTWTQEKRYENGKKSILTSFCLLRHPKVGWNTQQPRKPSSDCTLFGFGSLKSQKEHGYPGPMFYKL